MPLEFIALSQLLEVELFSRSVLFGRRNKNRERVVMGVTSSFNCQVDPTQNRVEKQSHGGIVYSGLACGHFCGGLY